jgi:transposase
MLKLSISEEEAKRVEYFRYHHPEPLIQKRFEVIHLKNFDLPNNLIARIANIHHDTVTKYIKNFNEGGSELLEKTFYKKNKSALMMHHNSIKDELINNPPNTINEAINKIEQITGIKRKATQVRKYIKNLGFKRLRCAQIPAKADTAKQKAFLEEFLLPRLNEAKAGKRVVLFMDAAHFVHSVFLGFVWCLTRLFIKSSSGRSRFNVLGAIDCVNKNLITVCNTSYINSHTICEILIKIKVQYVNLPVTIVLDNARYQKCNLVAEFAKILNIELLYLPPYSPNLNIIERLWKLVKKEVLYSKYYETFASFTEAIQTCLADLPTINKHKLDSLLTLKFQLFEKSG